MSDIAYAQLIDATPQALAQVEQIYLASFPPEEKKPFGDVIEGLRGGGITGLVGQDGDTILAMALLCDVPGAPLIFLPYLAVDKSCHSQGIGSGLFRFMLDFCRRTTAEEGIIWEVEPDVPGEFDHIHNRRIRFYERLGARMITQIPNYIVPNIVGEGIVPGRLMWVPLRGEERTLSRAEAVDWLRALYAIAYPKRPDLCEEIIAGMPDQA